MKPSTLKKTERAEGTKNMVEDVMKVYTDKLKNHQLDPPLMGNIQNIF